MPKEGYIREIKEDETWISITVTDQGTGGGSCGKCSHDFGTFVGSSICPGCKRKVVSQNTHTNTGGSDF